MLIKMLYEMIGYNNSQTETPTTKLKSQKI